MKEDHEEAEPVKKLLHAMVEIYREMEAADLQRIQESLISTKPLLAAATKLDTGEALLARARFQVLVQVVQMLKGVADKTTAKTAVQLLRRASRRCPDCATIHGELAEAAQLLGHVGGGLTLVRMALLSRRAAQRALELDPTCASANASMGTLALLTPKLLGGSSSRARDYLIKAVDAEPWRRDRVAWLRKACSAAGHNAEAVELLKGTCSSAQQSAASKLEEFISRDPYDRQHATRT